MNPGAEPVPGSPYEYPTYQNETPDPNDPDSPAVIVVLDENNVPTVYRKTVDPNDEDNMIYVEDPSVPLAGLTGEGSWALINLILAILTVAASAVLLLLYVVGKRRKEEEEERRGDEEESEEEVRKKLLWRIASVVVAVVSVIVFILTEDMSLPMEMVDKYTLWMLVIAMVQLIVCMLSKKQTEDGEDKDKRDRA